MPKIIRWEPFGNLQAEMERLFEEPLFRPQAAETALTAWAPNVDIYETANELVVQADLPGLEEKELDVRLENNMLSIRGERKFESRVGEDDYLRLERCYGSFSRSFSLPLTVHSEGIGAEYRDGVLTVRLPKREEAKPKQIKVSVNSAK